MATLSQDQKQLVQEKAKAIRVSIVQSVTAAKSGHPGGSLSIADVMSLLYFVEMNVDPSNPKKQDRDRFVLSKGHAAPALYATLAEKGYFPKSELINLRKINHFLQGHPDMKHTPGVDMSTGSLGQGIGHNIDELHQAIEEAKAFTDGPTCIVMHTVKGKGVAEMEGQAGWHGKAPSEEQGVAFVNEIMGVQ